MNRIGMSCTFFSARPPMEVIDEVSAHFRHWEIFSEVLHSVDVLPEGFTEKMDASGMTFSLHTSIADTDIAALNNHMREASVRELVSEMEWAVGRGIDTVTIHPGIICLSVKGVRDRSLEAARDSCRKLDKAAKDLGLAHVCIENMPNYGMMLGSTAEELHSIVDGTDLGITFDIGHANTAGQIDAMVDVFGDRIAHVHIHDNHGKDDEHLTIGDGDIDFDHVMKRLSGYKGRFIIESRSLESAVDSQEKLRRMLG